MSSAVDGGQHSKVIKLGSDLIGLVVRLSVFEGDSSCCLFNGSFGPSVRGTSSHVFQRCFGGMQTFLQCPGGCRFCDLGSSNVHSLTGTRNVIVTHSRTHRTSVDAAGGCLGKSGVAMRRRAGRFRKGLWGRNWCVMGLLYVVYAWWVCCMSLRYRWGGGRR